MGRGFFFQNMRKGEPMRQDDEIILRYAKEIIIKFIELGRISPGSFGDHFKTIYWGIKSTVVDAALPDLSAEQSEQDS
jgi:hypothetical protein